MSQPTVTAVVPMHNAAATIRRCLASIVAQTRPVERIVVVDDCSTDDSAAIVDGLRIANLELIRRPGNAGAGAARNVGIARAQTEFVAFLDADDWWLPTFVERVTDTLEEFGADFASSGGIRVNPDGPVRTRRVGRGGQASFDLTGDFWRVALRFAPIHTSATIARRSLVEQVGGFPEDVRIGEDLLLWIKLWVNGRFAFVDEPLFESVALGTGLAAGRLSYHDVRRGLVGAATGLGRAISKRKPGTFWFGVWFVRRVVNRHLLWLRRKVARATIRG